MRVAWLDEQFAELDTLVDSLGGYRRSELLTLEGAAYEKDGSITVTATVSDNENEGEAVPEGDYHIVEGSYLYFPN